MWRLQLLPGLRLATAGADGSIKLWPLAAYLAPEVAAAAGKAHGSPVGAPVESFRLSQSIMQASCGKCRAFRSRHHVVTKLQLLWLPVSGEVEMFFIRSLIILSSAFYYFLRGLPSRRGA